MWWAVTEEEREWWQQLWCGQRSGSTENLLAAVKREARRGGATKSIQTREQSYMRTVTHHAASTHKPMHAFQHTHTHTLTVTDINSAYYKYAWKHTQQTQTLLDICCGTWTQVCTYTESSLTLYLTGTSQQETMEGNWWWCSRTALLLTDPMGLLPDTVLAEWCCNPPPPLFSHNNVIWMLCSLGLRMYSHLIHMNFNL